MKRIMSLVVVAFAISSGVTYAADGPWGVRELKIAQDTALETFKEKMGDAFYNAIAGFSIDRNATGTSGRAKVIYQDGTEKKTVSYFCHVHEGTDIDCH